MRIGIDIDGVLVDFNSAFLKYFNQKHGTTYSAEDITHHEYKRVLRTPAEQIQQTLQEMDKTLTPFLLPDQHARAGIAKLSKQHKLTVITSRPARIYTQTVTWLNQQFGNVFSECINTGQSLPSGEVLLKSAACRQNKIDYMIEDELPNSLDCATNNINVLLLDRPWNRYDTLHEKVQRVQSWNEIVSILNK